MDLFKSCWPPSERVEFASCRGRARAATWARHSAAILRSTLMSWVTASVCVLWPLARQAVARVPVRKIKVKSFTLVFIEGEFYWKNCYTVVSHINLILMKFWKIWNSHWEFFSMKMIIVRVCEMIQKNDLKKLKHTIWYILHEFLRDDV